MKISFVLFFYGVDQALASSKRERDQRTVGLTNVRVKTTWKRKALRAVAGKGKAICR